LLFAIEGDEGTRFILLCVALSPVVDDGNDPVRHGEGRDCVWLFDGAGANTRNIVSTLAFAGWAKEDFREPAKLHGICNHRVIVGFNVGAKEGNAVFGKIEFANEDNFAGGVLF
jgi:hypothetical protein